MSSISFLARQAMELVINDVKKDFNISEPIKPTKPTKPTAPTAPAPPAPPEKSKYERERAQLMHRMYWHFRLKNPRDERVVTRLVAYYLVKYSQTAGDGLVRLKVQSNGKIKLKKHNPYNPGNYFNRKRHMAEYDATNLIAFDCERKQVQILGSLRESLTIEGVMNSESERIYITSGDLHSFTLSYHTVLINLFAY